MSGPSRRASVALGVLFAIVLAAVVVFVSRPDNAPEPVLSPVVLPTSDGALSGGVLADGSVLSALDDVDVESHTLTALLESGARLEDLKAEDLVFFTASPVVLSVLSGASLGQVDLVETAVLDPSSLTGAEVIPKSAFESVTVTQSGVQFVERVLLFDTSEDAARYERSYRDAVVKAGVPTVDPVEPLVLLESYVDSSLADLGCVSLGTVSEGPVVKHVQVFDATCFGEMPDLVAQIGAVVLRVLAAFDTAAP